MTMTLPRRNRSPGHWGTIGWMWCCVTICASKHPLGAGTHLFSSRKTLQPRYRLRPRSFRHFLSRIQVETVSEAMLSDEPEEEADNYSPAHLSALSTLSSATEPGCRSMAAVPRPAHGYRQKYDCCRIRGPAAQADAGTRFGAGASPGSRPALRHTRKL